MNPELRNIAVGMIFASILSLLSLGYIANALYGVGHEKLPDPVIEGAEQASAGAVGSAAKKHEVSVASLMAAAQPQKGAKTFKKKCTSCHTIEQGGKDKTGPNLFSIAKRGIGKKAGFKYSKGLVAKSAELWSDESLNSFLTKPAAYIKKTKMSFAGIKKPAARADLIAFLKSSGK